MDEWMIGWANAWVNELTGGWRDGCMAKQMDRCLTTYGLAENATFLKKKIAIELYSVIT